MEFLIMTIEVILGQNPSETWRRQHKFTSIAVNKNFAIIWPSPWISHLFSIWSFWCRTLFLQLGCFGLDFLSACMTD